MVIYTCPYIPYFERRTWKPRNFSTAATARRSGCHANSGSLKIAVYIKRLGSVVILLPFGDPWRSLLDGLDLFSADFMEDRSQGEVEVREPAFP